MASGGAHPTSRNDWSAYTGPGKAYFVKEELEFPDVPDPLEPANRGAAALNEGLLVYVADPVAAVWRRAVPQPVRSSLVRAFENLGYPARLVNNLLQAKFRGAGDETLHTVNLVQIPRKQRQPSRTTLVFLAGRPLVKSPSLFNV